MAADTGDCTIFFYGSKEKLNELMHMARPNGRFCGAKRPKCEAEQPLGFD